MASLKQVKYTLEHLDYVDGECNAVYIDRAIENLEQANKALESVGVRGRENLDMLLGCMLGIDEIIGNSTNKESDG